MTAELLAEKAVVVVAAVQTHVIEDSALAREIDLIAVRPCVMLTLGVSVSKSSNFLPRIGVVLTAVSFSVVLASVFAVSTVGVLVMVTRPSTDETVNATGTLSACPTVSAVLSSMAVEKPASRR